MEASELPEEIQIPFGEGLSDFVSAYYVRKPGDMVYIDFVQIDVAMPSPPGHGTAVARVVMHPSLAAKLADEISRQLAGDSQADTSG